MQPRQILWCSSQRRVDQLPSLPFLICGSSVGPSSVVQDLGVWIDTSLTMSTHITKVIASCFASLRQLHSVRRSVAGVFHKTRGRPCAIVDGLLQWSPCWTSCQVNLADCSPFSMRQSDWSMASVDMTTLHHCCSSFTGCLAVPEHVNFKLYVLVYHCLHGLGPGYFSRGFQARVQDSISPETAFSLQYRCRGSCHTPAFTWQPQFPVAGAQACNALPPSVTSVPSLFSIPRLLKTFLFQQQMHQ